MTRVRAASVVVAALALLPLAGCASGGASGGATGSSRDPASRGPITYAYAAGDGGVVKPLVGRWNHLHPREKVTPVALPADGTRRHEDLVRHFRAKDPGYDVVDLDVTWTAGLAANGWLQPLTGTTGIDTGALLPATVRAATFDQALYAAPRSTDAGLLYYRKDLVKTPPKNWDKMMAACRVATKHHLGCYAGDLADGTGLVQTVAEAVDSAGGSIVAPDGTTPTVASKAAAVGLGDLVTAVKKHRIPNRALGYDADQACKSFAAGTLLFMRNWPDCYATVVGSGSSVGKKVALAPLPGTNGHPGASVLGGQNTALSVYCDHTATAHAFVQYLESAPAQKLALVRGGLAPVRASLYQDPALQQQVAYLPTLLTSLLNAAPLPVTPDYPAVSAAVQSHAATALQGGTAVRDALQGISDAIETAATS